MSKYADDHASALSDVADAGSPVTFTRRSPGTEDASTGAFSGGSTTTVEGYATDANKGNLTRYQALNLVVSKARTLFFVPSTLGELPDLDSTVLWGSDTLTVKDVQPYAPDGIALFAEIIVVSG